MTFKLLQICLQNFMTYAEKVVNFSGVTRISGKNGKGKSSVLTAYMWLLFNCDYELNDNPKVRKDGIKDADVVVTAVFDIDGKEVSAKKVQKRKYSKDGSGYSDDNTYYINEVPKTLRDFNEYFGVDMTAFKICSNVNAFLGQKSKEMRDFLFGTVDEVTDLDVARITPALSELVASLEKYTVEELSAMHKASKAKVNKELPILDGQIKEAELNCRVDIDTAELELKKNIIKEQIRKAEVQLGDGAQLFEEYQSKVDEINSLKKKISEIERDANYKLQESRNTRQMAVNTAESNYNKSRQEASMLELSLSNTKKDIERMTAEKERLTAEYLAEKAKEHPPYEPIEELDPDSLICPTCGQNLPEDVKAEKMASFEERKTQYEADYAKKKALFLESKQKKLEDITDKGNSLKTLIASATESLGIIATRIETAKKDSLTALEEKSRQEELLSQLPFKPDLTEIEDYVTTITQIAEKESLLATFDTGKEQREKINLKLTELRAGLSETEKEIAKADTSAAEDRLEELRKQKTDMEQSKADCEKYLDLLDALDRSKNESLASLINAKFKCVAWELFELNKSGGYKSTCIPTIDGKSLLDISSNKGNRILGKLDICNSIQAIKGLNVPVFLDDAESLDDENILKAIGLMDCQMVVLKVSNDMDVKVEVLK